MDGSWLAFAAVCVAAFVAGRSTRRKIDSPPIDRRPTSRFVERVEAPGSRPVRVCGRKNCRRPIFKEKEGDEMVVRIEGESILYLHGTCSDDNGEPLP